MDFDKDPLELVDMEKLRQLGEKLTYGGGGRVEFEVFKRRHIRVCWVWPSNINIEFFHQKAAILRCLKKYLNSVGFIVHDRTHPEIANPDCN